MVALGNIVEIKGGGTPSKANSAFWGGDIPWVSPKDMKRWEIADAEDKITVEAIKGSATNLIPKNAILIVNRSGILKHTLPVGITQRPVAINQDIKALICGARADAGYVAHIVKASESVVLKWVRATTADNFSIDNLRRLEIPLPPLVEQRRIAAILDRADALRRKRKRAIELLDSLSRSTIDAAYATTLPTKALGELCDVQGGLQLTHARVKLPMEVPYLRVANVHRDRLDLSEVKTMRVSEGELRRTLLAAGDILFVEGHGNAAEIGRCAVWDGSLAPCIHQNHLIRARPISMEIDPILVSFWLNSEIGRRNLLRRGKTTSGLNTINVSDVREIRVPCLPSQEREALRMRLGQIGSVRGHYSKQLFAWDDLFSSLQSRAFSGQL
ncbi:MAG: restriction endonuclease subunit S [Mesorhizobium sp.]|nr:restriction endonuclease subunit S [Mesorhizobium sp. M2A.F.Ca.ET.067.02.1.1]TIU58203.1 MAG: restriction endonuclease subunit S [Mesorhizobium sp.]TIV41736.1 MAG: restriction endonuclease subunit S [Mesorhizobium sp.]TIW87747.1 MAG: restriction endonuclease subunit S [Mesorhizobium sp.]